MSCGFRVTRSRETHLLCESGSNRQWMSVTRSSPPHPQPFSPATKASTTRPRRGGEGSQNKKREITPPARTANLSRLRLHRLQRLSEIASAHVPRNPGPDFGKSASKSGIRFGLFTHAPKRIFFVHSIGPAAAPNECVRLPSVFTWDQGDHADFDLRSNLYTLARLSPWTKTSTTRLRPWGEGSLCTECSPNRMQEREFLPAHWYL